MSGRFVIILYYVSTSQLRIQVYRGELKLQYIYRIDCVGSL